MSEELLIAINDSFDPYKPLLADDPRYVDCHEVRGERDILISLGNPILRSKQNVCRLYTGHRGNGKSTELLWLQKHLESNNCLAVYFAAEEKDIEPENTQYTDILLACTKHLIEAVKQANSDALRDWLIARWQDLKGILLTEIEIDKMGIEVQLAQFGKMTASIKSSPNQRQAIRDKLEPHTVSLREALNEFIRDAKLNLPDGKKRIVVIADNLDRITIIDRGNGKTNYDEIFLDRASFLKGLECDVIYTIPIALAYSSRATDLQDLYGSPEILPMVTTRNRDRQIHDPGLNQMISVIQKRVSQLTTKSLVPDIFETNEIVLELCLMSGGHMRTLMSIVQATITNINNFPITQSAIRQGMTKLRGDYRRAIEDNEHNEWELLARTTITGRIENNSKYRKLLLNRCILQYGYMDGDEFLPWYNVHPLIMGIAQYIDALAKVRTDMERANASK